MATRAVTGVVARCWVASTDSRFEKAKIGEIVAGRDKETMERAPRSDEKRAKGKEERMLVTERDRAIVEWVHEAGVSTREQIQRLLFSAGGRSRCQRRLTLLYRRRFLDRLPNRYPNVPDVYYLSRRSIHGLRLLRALTGEQPRVCSPNKVMLPHTLDIVDCRVQIMRACRTSGVSLVRWLNEEELRYMTARDGILPDAYFQLARPANGGMEKRSGFFLEVERSGKADRALTEKLRRYGAFYYGGGFEQRFGLRALRVLWLIGSEYGIEPDRQIDRMAKLAEAAGVTFLRFAALGAFLATPISDLLTRPDWRQPRSEGLVPLFSRTDRSDAQRWQVNGDGD